MKSQCFLFIKKLIIKRFSQQLLQTEIKMSSLKAIWDCMFSPKLIKIYTNGPVEKVYQPNTLESWGDQVLNSLYVIWKFGFYTSPFLVGFLYQRGYLESEGLVTLTKFVTSVGVILVVSFCIRSFSRAQNPTYTKFLNTLQTAQKELTPITKKQLNMYDFEFKAWPVEFTCTLPQSASKQTISKPSQHSIWQFIFQMPYKIIAYLAIHTFGIRLIYPGSMGFLQIILEQSLLQGRSRLVQQFHGERFKIKTVDDNEIDTMFIDRRNTNNSNRNNLVICCEGNAGFYEIGIAITPIEVGYSVLGWNHPGFGGSTGTPYPSQEQNAVNAVMQLAIDKLNFKPENILVFGWSIGGYSSSWLAMNYPDIKGIIVDATFDDILPLAVNHMPRWWAPIVECAIRDHVDLNIYENLSKYPGPILLIRRTEDEVLCLKENDLSTNRGNDLLIKLLKFRYPCIFKDIQTNILLDYLAVAQGSQEEFIRKYTVDEKMSQSLLQSYVSEYSKCYPMKIGEEFSDGEKTRMALFLARKYMKDFRASHCVNLSDDLFQLPWDVYVESDFVFT